MVGDDFASGGEQHQILLEALAESDARVSDHHSWLDTRIEQAPGGIAQNLPDLGDDITVARVVLHALRQALHVHDADRATVLRDNIDHLWIR